MIAGVTTLSTSTTTPHVAQPVAVDAAAVVVPASTSYHVWPDTAIRHELAAVARQHALAVQRDRTKRLAAHRAAQRQQQASRSEHRRPLGGCTAANWRSTMTSDEIWIDTRESSLNPYARNGQYWGLGQLGPSYAWTADPCQQLRDQRDYIAGRYGSEDAAVAFWRSHGWY